jgi:hypothetical protein
MRGLWRITIVGAGRETLVVGRRRRREIVRRRRLSGSGGRPLNFTVRRHPMRSLPALTAVAISACSTSNSCPHMHFERFREADRAVVSVDSRAVGPELRSPDTLRALADFAQAHSTGWQYPWFAPPVARLRVDFFSGTRFLGDFGVGTNFLEAQGCDYFQSRRVDSDDRRKLIALIGVADPYAAPSR